MKIQSERKQKMWWLIVYLGRYFLFSLFSILLNTNEWIKFFKRNENDGEKRIQRSTLNATFINIFFFLLLLTTHFSLVKKFYLFVKKKLLSFFLLICSCCNFISIFHIKLHVEITATRPTEKKNQLHSILIKNLLGQCEIERPKTENITYGCCFCCCCCLFSTLFTLKSIIFKS